MYNVGTCSRCVQKIVTIHTTAYTIMVVVKKCMKTMVTMVIKIELRIFETDSISDRE